MKGPRVLALFGDENGCTLWRVWQPYAELQRRGYGAWFRHKDDPQTYAPEFPYLAATRLDAVIIPRLYWRERVPAQRWVQSLHNAGLAVIYELDDDVLTPQIGARQHATTEPDRSIEDLEQDRRDRIAALRLSDGVTVTSPQLAAVVRQYVAPHTPVLTLPNRLDVQWFRSCVRRVRRTVAPLTLGWAGGARHQEDLEPVAEAWHNIARRYPDVRFVVQGFLSSVLTSAVPTERCHTLPWFPVAEYPQALKNIDIACASVADNHFNRCKTPIKLWEYTLGGAVSVVSPTLYGAVVQDGVDGLAAETAAEWEAALARLIESCQLRRTLWRAQRRRIAQDHSLERHVLEWPKAWQHIIDTFRARQSVAA